MSVPARTSRTRVTHGSIFPRCAGVRGLCAMVRGPGDAVLRFSCSHTQLTDRFRCVTKRKQRNPLLGVSSSVRIVSHIEPEPRHPTPHTAAGHGGGKRHARPRHRHPTIPGTPAPRPGPVGPRPPLTPAHPGARPALSRRARPVGDHRDGPHAPVPHTLLGPTVTSRPDAAEPSRKGTTRMEQYEPGRLTATPRRGPAAGRPPSPAGRCCAPRQAECSPPAGSAP